MSAKPPKSPEVATNLPRAWAKRARVGAAERKNAALPPRDVPELSAEKRKLYAAFGGPDFSADVVIADFLERYGR